MHSCQQGKSMGIRASKYIQVPWDGLAITILIAIDLPLWAILCISNAIIKAWCCVFRRPKLVDPLKYCWQRSDLVKPIIIGQTSHSNVGFMMRYYLEVWALWLLFIVFRLFCEAAWVCFHQHHVREGVHRLLSECYSIVPKVGLLSVGKLVVLADWVLDDSRFTA